MFTFDSMKHPVRVTVLLQGLDVLINFYAPALYLLGIQVRELNWEGGVDGTVKVTWPSAPSSSASPSRCTCCRTGRGSRSTTGGPADVAALDV